MDLDAWAFVLTVFLGRLIRLAKDCELLDIWSSATNLARCVPRAGVFFAEALLAVLELAYAG
jgi:hypothetical protein